MSSSRPMRKSSRMSSPMDSALKGSLPAEEDGKMFRERSAKIADWEEPPLRNPAPSFEDYKGLERHGVLEHMAPLGTLPNQKVRLRLKAHEPSRRLPQVRNGEVAVTREEVNPSDSTPPIVTRRSEPRKMEDRPSKLHSSRERDEDLDYLPKGVPKTTPVKSNPSQPSLQGTPSSRTSAGQARLRQVVDSAVERANELGNPVLGLAVKKLFDESLHNRTLADLLDAVLSQKPTSRQAADFQGYIKVARKQIKAESDPTHSSLSMGKVSKSASKSPSKSVRPTVARHTGIAKDFSDATEMNDVRNLTPSALRHRAKNVEGNGSIMKADRPAKRRKRSRSASSLSSLSSLSSMDQDFTPTVGADQADTAKVNASVQSITHSKIQPQLGPKLHTFSTTKFLNTSIKRPGTTPGSTLDESTEEFAAKRRKLHKTFDDYAVNDSGIRAAPLPKKQTQLPSFAPSLVTLRTQQPRLRNGTSQRARRDDYDDHDLQSPGSSAQSELLIPPPAGAQSSSRGATPNHLGRPLKLVKKAARIKMSPMKKRTGVIAGIGDTARGKDSTVGYTDDNGEDVNLDQCSACSGNGKLLCCDGCVRSFHFSCLDPPMDPARPPDGEWFCFKCIARREPRSKAPRNGVFSSLMYNMDEKNPTAYHLPYDVRDFFEGVKTGEEGEYEENFPSKKPKPGWEEAPNYIKLKGGTGDNTTILCYHCGKSSLGQREIIGCDFCNLQWHLDCLEPPMAAPPRKLNKYSWMCPNHIDSELQALYEPSSASGTAHPVTARLYKVRRPKHPLIRDVAMRRGFRNNGLIEIENEPEEEKDDEAVIYRLHENGIKLDFINRVKRANMELDQQQPNPRARARDARRLRVAAIRSAKAKAQRIADQKLKDAFDNRPFLDRQAALNLAQFSLANSDLDLGSSEVENLIGTLIAEAPSDVAALYPDDGVFKGKEVSGPSSSTQQHSCLSGTEKQTLVLIQELIRRRLVGSDDGEAS